MAYLGKWLVAGGLVLVTSPFCFMASAQDYVDVEAERGSRTTPATPDTATPAPEAASPGQGDYAYPDSFSTAPADTGSPAPATSYGLGGSAAGPALTAAPPTTGAAPVAGAAGTGNMGTLFLEVQQLRQDVMRLNGIVEEQANELRELKAQSLERYVDMDKRISALGGGAAAPTTNSNTITAGGGAAAMGKSAELPGESDAYRAAYALVRSQSFDKAVDAFNQFLREYPDGKYAPNAHYWLGELYLVIDPPDPEASRQAFTLLLSEYPDNPKAPDAMFKLGKVYFLKGNRAKSREYLDRVISEYGSTNNSAVQMARDFIDENF